MNPLRMLLVVGFLGAAPAQAAEVPDWLVSAAATAAPSDTGAAVMLLSEQVVSISASGKVVVTERGAVLILRSDGSDDAVARVHYDAGSDRVRDLTAWIIPPGGRGWSLPSSREADLAQIDEAIYSDLRVRRISAGSDAVPGAVFGYEWTRESRQVFTQFSWSFQSERPCRLSRYAIEVPRGWTAEGVVFHHAPVAPRIEGDRYVWELTDLPGVADEPARPPLTSIVVRLGVSCRPPAGTRTDEVVHFSTWSDVARWLDRLTEPMHVPTAEVANRAREVVLGARSEIDSVRAVGRWVQRLRYASIPMDLHRGGGYRPAPAPTTFARGYGDCKDKANLMRSMLAVLGIESRLVAVHSGDPEYAEAGWPSPHAFNHCILAVRSRAGARSAAAVIDSSLGALTLFDPTDPYVRFGDLPEGIQGSLALVIAAGAQSPVRVPRFADRGTLERQTALDLREGGMVVGRLRDRARGATAVPLRALLLASGTRERQATLERWMARTSAGTRITALEASDDSLGDDVSLRLEFEAPAYGQVMQGRLLMFEPFMLPSVDRTLLALAEPRRHPILVPAVTLRETVTVALPAGFRVDELPDPLTLETPFGRYAASLRVTDRTLVATRNVEIQAVRLAPGELRGARDFHRAIRRFEGSPVVLARE